MSRKFTSLKNQLEEIGISVTAPDSKRVRLDMTLASSLRLLECHDRLDWVSDDKYNVRGWLSGDAGSGFAGGSAANLRKNLSDGPNMKPFQASYDAFLKNRLGEKLQTVVTACQPKRTRRFSEHDGEWSYDRRFEIEPFSRTEKKLAPARIIRIEAQFIVSASASAADVDRYGATVWAISQLIEQAGIQTEIYWNIYSHGAGQNLDADISMLVKKPGEYLAPSMLAACFTTVFLRRLGFTLLTAAPNLVGIPASYGLGRAENKGQPVEFSSGLIRLTPSAAKGYDDEIHKAVLDAIKGEE